MELHLQINLLEMIHISQDFPGSQYEQLELEMHSWPGELGVRQ